MKHVNGIGALFRMIPTQIWSLEHLKTPEAVQLFTRVRGGLVSPLEAFRKATDKQRFQQFVSHKEVALLAGMAQDIHSEK